MSLWATLWLNLAVRWDEWRDRRVLLGERLLEALRVAAGRSVRSRS